MRPAVGIANNGDFPKLAGSLSLGPEDGTWVSHRQYGEFVYRYVRADRYQYNRGFSKAEYLSSEYFLLKLARGLQRIFQPGPRFDIRWLGAINSIFFLLAISVWIYALPTGWRILAGLPLVFIWTDVAYVQYMNSFYMDTAALIFVILLVGTGLHVSRNPKSRGFPVLMVSAGSLFAASKSQHAIPGLILIPLFLWLAFSEHDRVRRATWIAGSLMVVIATSLLVSRTTQQYRSMALFTVIFWRLAPSAPDPLRALQELGLGKGDLRYLHTHAYSPNSPVSNPEWARQFAGRCTYGKLLFYYFRHPAIPARFIFDDLSGAGSRIRPYANRSPDDGFVPGLQSPYFTWWTDLRSYLLKHAPWHLFLLALPIIISATWTFLRSPADRLLAVLALLTQALQLSELGLSVLADAAETDRHLFVFQVTTEISILLFPALMYKISACRPRYVATDEPGKIKASVTGARSA